MRYNDGYSRIEVELISRCGARMGKRTQIGTARSEIWSLIDALRADRVRTRQHSGTRPVSHSRPLSRSGAARAVAPNYAELVEQIRESQSRLKIEKPPPSVPPAVKSL